MPFGLFTKQVPILVLATALLWPGGDSATNRQSETAAILPLAQTDRPLPWSTPDGTGTARSGANYATSLRWAQRLWTVASDLPSRQREGVTYLALGEARSAFLKVVERFGPRTEAELGLGRSELALGYYQSAEEHLRLALGQHPTVTTAALFKAARKRGEVARNATRLLSPEQRVVQVVPVRCAGRPRWAALIAAGDSREYEYWQDLHLILLRRTCRGLRTVWRSPSIEGDEWGDDWGDAHLYVRDLNADGYPELFVMAKIHGCS